MTTNNRIDVWSVEGMWDAGMPEPFPLGGPVIVPSVVAQWAMRTFPLAGNAGLGRPVLRVGGELFLLSFASAGQWWVVRLPEVTV